MTRDECIDAIASWLAIRDGWNPNSNERTPQVPLEIRALAARWAHVRDAYREDAVDLLDAIGLEEERQTDVDPANERESFVSASHQCCVDAGKHVCQKPSGGACIEDGCDRPAGTLWGPLWCPEHDQERLDRISSQMVAISRSWVPADSMAARSEPQPPETPNSSGGFCG